MSSGRHARRELEHLLHGGAAGDEVLRGRVAGDALAQQVQLALAFGHVSFAAIEFLEAPVHSLPKALDLLSKIRALKVEPKRLQSRHPSSLHPFPRPSMLARLVARHSVSRK